MAYLPKAQDKQNQEPQFLPPRQRHGPYCGYREAQHDKVNEDVEPIVYVEFDTDVDAVVVERLVPIVVNRRAKEDVRQGNICAVENYRD